MLLFIDKIIPASSPNITSFGIAGGNRTEAGKLRGEARGKAGAKLGATGQRLRRVSNTTGKLRGTEVTQGTL